MWGAKLNSKMDQSKAIFLDCLMSGAERIDAAVFAGVPITKLGQYLRDPIFIREVLAAEEIAKRLSERAKSYEKHFMG